MNFKRFNSILILTVLLLGIGVSRAESAPVKIDLQASRNYGYSMGDEIKLTALIETQNFYSLEEGSLPQPAPVNSWLVLKSAQLEEAPSDYDYKLKLTYQIFKDVRKSVQQTIPALPLQFSRAGKNLSAEIPAWAFTYHPLLPEQTPNDQLQIQPELSAEKLDPGKHSRNIRLLILLLVAVCFYIAWFYGKIPFLERYSGPFGLASRKLKKLANQNFSEQSFCEAVKCFHNAINDTCGKTVFLEQLPEFFENHPAYLPVRKQTEEVFRISRQLFFTDAPVVSDQNSIKQIEALCQLYRKIERGSKWI